MEYINRQDWRSAFEAVIPPRKFLPGKRKKGKIAAGRSTDTAEGTPSEDASELGEKADRSEADLDDA